MKTEWEQYLDQQGRRQEQHNKVVWCIICLLLSIGVWVGLNTLQEPGALQYTANSIDLKSGSGQGDCLVISSSSGSGDAIVITEDTNAWFRRAR